LRRYIKWTATKWIHETAYDNPVYKPPACEDDAKQARQCAGWAAGGECAANPGFMIGTGMSPGSCIASCCRGGRVNMATAKVGRCRLTPGCPMLDPGLTAHGFQHLMLNYDEPLPSFASNFNSRRYTKESTRRFCKVCDTSS
jgi:hypothetical protein